MPVLLLLAVGVFARVADLGTHFSHCDDLGPAKNILVYKGRNALTAEVLAEAVSRGPGEGYPEPFWYGADLAAQKLGCLKPWAAWRNLFHEMTAVSRWWTYAPLQYFLTYYLLHQEQSYRQVLFWGRLPSFFAGVLGLLLMAGFFKGYDGYKTPAYAAALAVSALSWENIIYAKQMSSYSLGVCAAAGILWLLLREVRAENFSARRLYASAAWLALFSHAQYQIFLWVPPFFLTVLAFRLRKDEKVRSLIHTAGSVFLYAVLVLPLVLLFFQRHMGRGVDWNAGSDSEYCLRFAEDSGMPARILHAAWFFLRNFPEVFVSQTAMVPEGSLFYVPLAAFWIGLFCLGLWRFMRTSVRWKRALGMYFLLLGAAVAVPVLQGKLALSPTRHNLIWLPAFCVPIGEGFRALVCFLTRRVWTGYRTRHLPLFFSAALAVLFLFHSGRIFRERRDPFDEKKIIAILAAHGADTVVATDFTWNLGFMPAVWKNANLFEEYYMRHPFVLRRVPSYQTVAFISHREPLSEQTFVRMRDQVNAYQLSRLMRREIRSQEELAAGLWNAGFSDYRTVYSETVRSDTEIDFSRKLKNGSNNFYLTVLQKN